MVEISRVGTEPAAWVISQRQHNPIDRKICALTNEEEKELVTIRNIHKKRELVELGKARATAIEETRSFFDTGLDRIIEHFVDDNTLRDTIKIEALTTEEAIYTLKSVSDINILRLNAAIATIGEYTTLYEKNTKDCSYYNPDSTEPIYLYPMASVGRVEDAIEIAKESIGLFRQENEKSLGKVCNPPTT